MESIRYHFIKEKCSPNILSLPAGCLAFLSVAHSLLSLHTALAKDSISHRQLTNQMPQNGGREGKVNCVKPMVAEPWGEAWKCQGCCHKHKPTLLHTAHSGCVPDSHGKSCL